MKQADLSELQVSTTVLEELFQMNPEEAEPEILSREPRAPGTPAPLSFGQQRLWFLQQTAPWSCAYNVSVAVRMQGALDIEALRESLREITRRHEALRTRFPLEGDQPVQIVDSGQELDLTVISLENAPADQRDAVMRSRAEQYVAEPFDLVVGPLIRYQLFRFNEREHVFFAVAHHIVCDGWSIGILSWELSVLYNTFARRKPSSLPDLPFQYADFALWQRSTLMAETLDHQLYFWKTSLAGSPPVLELPGDYSRPVTPTYRGGSCNALLSPAISKALQSLGARHGVTLHTTLLAAFAVFLGKYTGGHDFVIGTPIASRSPVALEQLIGFFVNTLPLRVNWNGAPAFLDLLAAVRNTALDGFSNQDAPLERIVEALHPDRGGRLSQPLFRALFVLQNAPSALPALSGLELELLRIPHATAKFDLSLRVEEGDRGLNVEFEYSADLFERQTVEQMLRHYCNLLSDILRDPTRTVSELNIFSEEERVALLPTEDRVSGSLGPPSCIHELFEAQAARVPNSVAVVSAGRRLTYDQLDRKANQLAHYLRSLQIGPEKLVGICLDRSVDTIVALLGVLKAGGAYVPIEPSLPPLRLANLLNDSGVELLLTDSEGAKRVPLRFVNPVIDLEEAWTEIEFESEDNPGKLSMPGNLAYVIHTSGSSGKPKAVGVEHAQLFNYVCAASSRLDLDTCGSFAFVSSFAADLGNTALFPALCLGASLHLLSEKEAKDPEALATYFQQREIDCVKITPSHLEALLNASRPERVLPKRKLILGGEALRWPLVNRIRQLAPACEIYNHYGPTETTVGVAATLVDDQEPPSGMASVGPSLANSYFYILNEDGQPVPPGVAGELFIGGENVARGYLNAPAATAEKFLPNPFSGRGGARLYRTGDQARRLRNGCFEIVGRKDRQLKIRGYRVELGEIELTLCRHPEVQQAAVIAKEGERGERRLIAYLTGNAQPEDVRNFLREELPEYMVPSAFVPLDKFPLTGNGKIDFHALPDYTPEGPSSDDKTGPTPETPIAELVSGIWGELLGVTEVSPEDDFFDLGGHSILAIQVMSHIQRAVGVELPLTGLFETPTLGQLVQYIETTLPTSGKSAIPALAPVPRNGDLPLSFAQQRLWFLQQFEADSPAYNMHSLLRLEGPVDVSILERSLTEVLRRHEVLRTTYAKNKGQAVQIIHPPHPISLVVTDLQGLPDQERGSLSRQLMEEEARRPFDLEHGPMLRACLHRLDDRVYRLLLSTNHIACDGWSVGLMFGEISKLYAAFLENKGAALPELPVQYADYAAWQRQWMSGETLETQLQYWRDQLSPHPPVLQLPADRPHPPVQTFRGDRLSFHLGEKRTAELKAIARKQDVTLFMLLLAAFQTLLARYSGQDDIAVGTPVANRDIPALEPLVGFFVNTLVLRTDLSGDPSFEEALRRVRKVALGAYAHQHVPFEYIVEKLQPARDLGRTPFFQVMFELYNVPNAPLELPDIFGVREPLNVHTAQFDLTLSLGELPGGLVGSWEYNTDLFDEATIACTADHFVRLLDGLLENTEARISDLPLLSTGEMKQLTSDWNQTDVTYPDQRGLVARFEEWAEKTPNAIAAREGKTSLTYVELNRRANRVAWRLIACGVGPDCIVALLQHRGISLLTAILGVYKAGGAYLPLDPRHPVTRQAQVVRESGVRWALGDNELLAALKQAVLGPSWDNAPELINFDHCVQEGGRDQNPPAPNLPESLAYVLYTSGSVGRPKGVLVHHAGMMNTLNAKIDDLKLTANDRVAQTASQCFDISVWQLLTIPLVGGCVQFFGDDVIHTPEQLLNELSRERVAVFETVPSLLSVMLNTKSANARSLPALPSLRALMLTGEATPPQVCREWFAHYSIPIVNAYGVSECSDDSTYFWLYESPKPEMTLLPIGAPLPNARVYILDRHLHPVPVGVCGELFLGGIGVGRGYLHDPAQTAERFVPDSFSGASGARLFRTGDIARYLPDGNVEYLGRVDHQVKVRGFRVELGEIEETLLQHDKIREAAVVAGSNESLVGYVSTPSPESLRPGELRSFLKERLPDYMVPSAFAVLEDLPHNANGKIDRKRLPPVQEIAAPASGAWAPPRDFLEHQLCDIWRETLGQPEIGITDNFFELGGHSLLAVRLMALVEDLLGKSLPLSALFQGPTIEHMAHLLRERPASGLWSPLVSIQTAGAKLPFFAVHPTGGDVLCYYHLSQLLGNDQPFYAFQARGLEASTQAVRSIKAMASDYIAAMRSVQPHGPYIISGWSFGGVVAYEIAQQLRAANEPVALVAILDSLAPVSHTRLTERSELTRTQWAQWMLLLGNEFERVFPAQLALSETELEFLEPARQVDYFVDALRKIDFLPPGGGRSIAKGFARVHEANTVALWNYVQEARSYNGPVALIRSEEMTLLADSWAQDLHDNQSLGWSRLVEEPIDVLDVPGDHNRLLQWPFVASVAEKLKLALEAANSTSQK